MHKDLRNVWDHMLDLGICGLAHAVQSSVFAPFENRRIHELSVLHAAHAAEILLKARIAQEHPLLIFERVPDPIDDATTLTFEALVERGQTIQYQSLPTRLWATTGLRLSDLQLYKDFGRLRNSIQHFASPIGRDLSRETLAFIFGVLDPFINECWGIYAVDYNEDTTLEYVIEGLLTMRIPFLVSRRAAEEWRDERTKLDEAPPAYRELMLGRLRGAKEAKDAR